MNPGLLVPDIYWGSENVCVHKLVCVLSVYVCVHMCICAYVCAHAHVQPLLLEEKEHIGEWEVVWHREISCGSAEVHVGGPAAGVCGTGVR